MAGDMASPPTTGTLEAGHQAAKRMRRLLLDLGADEQLVRRVHGTWTDGADVPHVYMPPVPASIVEHLTRLLPPGAVS
jgi:hypothetical protein